MLAMIAKPFSRLFVAFTLSITLILALPGVIPNSDTTHAYSASKAKNIVSTGKAYKGTPYRFGAKYGNTRAFDCSSFTQYIYRSNGVYLPRTSKQQAKYGKFVSRSNLKPGDLVFFYSPISHVAIYIGNGKILHTYGKPGVTISNMKSGWWSRNYKTARRVL